jgi:uncharacterized RDD family membrane protein YckC
MVPAGWGIRTLAFMIDAVLVAITCIIYLIFGFVFFFRMNFTQILRITELSEAFELLQSNLNLGSFLILAVGLLFYVFGAVLIYSLYFIGLEKVYATTIGKKLFGLLVVDNSGIRLTWKQSILRNFTKLPGIIEFLPFDIILGIVKLERGRSAYQRATEILAEAIVIRST